MDREKKAEVHNVLVIEQGKEKLVGLLMLDEPEEAGRQGRRGERGHGHRRGERQQVQALKDMIKKTIMGIRKKQAEKVHQMQIIAKLESQTSRESVDMIRIKTAVQAVKAAVAGDEANCTLDQPKSQIEDYCYKAFKDDAESIQDCMVLLLISGPRSVLLQVL